MRVEQIIAPNGKLWSEIKKKTKKRVSKTGKLGIVRLAGKDMTALREQAYDRAQGLCELKLPGCDRYAGFVSGHLAHIRGKRNHGDHLQQVQWSCAKCHNKSHVYGKDGQKPCPKRSKKIETRSGNDS